MNRIYKKFLFVAIISLWSLGLYGQELTRITQDVFDIEIPVGDSLFFFEDVSGKLNFEDLYEKAKFKNEFVGTDEPPGAYWIKFRLLNETAFDKEIKCFFDRTSYVEFYMVSPTDKLTKALSGNGRKRSEMKAGDSRNHVAFTIQSNQVHTVYIKFKNNTDYLPTFGVWFQDSVTYTQDLTLKTIRNISVIGAAFILALYALSMFLIHRYIPYMWLAIHAVGFMTYSLASGDYLVDWFFPESPSLGLATPWSLVGHFGLLMLTMVFLKMKQHHPLWFQIIRALAVLTILQLVMSLYLVYGLGGYVSSTKMNLYLFLVNVLVLAVMLLSIWKKLNKSKRVFGLGIWFFISMLLLGVVSWLMIDTLGRSWAIVISSSGSLGEVLFFAIALGIEMRQHEVDKNKALDELNDVLTEQNQTIQKEVDAQTRELREKNERIETLFREIHHRVKNNLQLISSLLNTQREWSSTEDPAKAIEDSRSRVVAMSMIHQFLYRNDDIATIDFGEYAEELVSKLDHIQTQRIPYKLYLDFDKEYIFDIDTSISLGLILNELVTNSYKHAVKEARDLQLKLTLIERDKDKYELTYLDNGTEMATSFEEATKRGFGLRLASRLSKQLQGSFSYEYRNGNQFKVWFVGEKARLELID